MEISTLSFCAKDLRLKRRRAKKNKRILKVKIKAAYCFKSTRVRRNESLMLISQSGPQKLLYTVLQVLATSIMSRAKSS